MVVEQDSLQTMAMCWQRTEPNNSQKNSNFVLVIVQVAERMCPHVFDIAYGYVQMFIEVHIFMRACIIWLCSVRNMPTYLLKIVYRRMFHNIVCFHCDYGNCLNFSDLSLQYVGFGTAMRLLPRYGWTLLLLKWGYLALATGAHSLLETCMLVCEWEWKIPFLSASWHSIS